MVIPDLPQQAVKIRRTFKECAEMAGLTLNVQKTVVIVFWHQELQAAKRDNTPAGWEELEWAFVGAYFQ
jgi:hypothetical protein